MSKVLIIIPAYNEEKNIVKVCQGIKGYDFIVINDASTDLTEQILNEHRIPHLTHIFNLGIGGAMQTGYKYAAEHGYEVAVQFDGDGQHNLEYVKTISDPILNKEADLVIGSRFITKSGTFRSTFARRIGIRIVSDFMRFATGHRIHDTTSGFRAAGPAVIADFANDYPNEYPEPITTATCLRKGYKVKEVSVEMNARRAGKSSIHSWKKAYYMFNVCVALLLIKTRRYKK